MHSRYSTPDCFPNRRGAADGGRDQETDPGIPGEDQREDRRGVGGIEET
jgi:hypothetical protein